MIWLGGSLTYGLVALVTWRILTPHFAWLMAERATRYCFGCHRDTEPSEMGPSSDAWFGAFCLAFLAATFWPIAALWALNFPTVGAASRAKLREQERRIHELEQEAGIT